MTLARAAFMWLLLSPAMAHADDDTSMAALVAFGLPGVWAADCSKPPSEENRRVHYEAGKTGPARMQISDDGETYGDDSMLSDAELLPNGDLRFYMAKDEEFGATTTMHRSNGRIRIMQAVSSTGVTYIADGIWVELKKGARSESLERCDLAPPVS